MSQIDIQYKELVNKIISHGVSTEGQSIRPVYADGKPAHYTFTDPFTFKIDSGEVPILTTKKIGALTPIKELLWIMQDKSNNVDLLVDKYNVHIWDEWRKEDGTIGPAYGFQMNKKVFKSNNGFIDQVDRLIKGLKEDPLSRRHVTSLWNIDDLDDMALAPCVWNTQWIVNPQTNELNLMVQARSSDVALGLPYNLYQYYVFQRMIAQVTGYKPGTFTFTSNQPHIYNRHIPLLQEQVAGEQYNSPSLELNTNIDNFYDFTPDDFSLVDYNHGKTFSYEIAI